MEDNKNTDQEKKESFFSLVKSDVMRWRPTYSHFFFIRLLFLQHGFQLAFSIRLQQKTIKIPVIGKLLTTLIWYITYIITGADCSPKAKYGKGLYFPHPSCVIIGTGVNIKDNISVYQGVTLGRSYYDTVGYPEVKDGAFIYAGAKIIGAVSIGENSVIGANAVVTKDVPDNMVAVGIPAKIFPQKKDGSQ